MIRRQIVAVLALLGILDATYLLLHKLGYVGTLACTVDSRSCDVVNTSIYSTFMGLPVAGIGVAGYALMLGVALYAARPAMAGDRRPDIALAVLSGGGLAFSIYLTYLSLFRIGTACPYCLVSLGIVTAIFGLSVWSVLQAPSGGSERDELAVG